MSMKPKTFSNVFVKGMHFRGEAAKAYAEAMQPGDNLTIEREPDNQYDANAIKVITPNGMHLGYLAKEDAAWIAGWLDEGFEFTVTCERVEFAQNNHYPVVTLTPVLNENPVG